MELTSLPSKWVTIRLKDISAFITKGATPTTYGFKWEEAGIPFLRSECVAEGGLDMAEAMYISPKAHALLRRSEIRDGDILMTITGNVGRIVVLRNVGAANMNQHVARIRISSRFVESDYVFHALSRPEYRKYFNSITTGQAYPQISLRQVREAEIPIPPLSEQSAIATALSDVDALLAAQDALVAKKRAIRQGAMQELLTGKRRLPGFSEEWKVKRLGEHLELLRSGAISRAELTADGELKYLHYGDIHGTDAVFLDPGAVVMPFLPDEKAARLDRLKDGDLVFADASEDISGVGKSIELRNVLDLQVVSGMHTIAVRFDKEVLADGFKAYLQEIPAFRSHLRRLASGTKVYATSIKHISSAKLSLPRPDEQRAISRFLSEMDLEIVAIECRREKIAQLKQGMMQELLTGRIRMI